MSAFMSSVVSAAMSAAIGEAMSQAMSEALHGPAGAAPRSCGEARVRRLAEQAWSEHFGGRPSALTAVGSPASGQAVFRVSAPQAGAPVYVKVYAEPVAAQQRRRLGALAAAVRVAAGEGAALRPCRAIGVDDSGHCLLLEAAEGEELAAVATGAPLDQALEQLGAALAQLHALNPALLATADGATPVGLRRAASLDGQIAALMRLTPLDLVQRRPALAGRVTALLAGIDACLPRRLPIAPSHRDLHPRQAFVRAGRVTLIDWDLAGPADPALDLANLLMHLERRWPDSGAAAALRRGYGPAWDAAAPRLPAWRAFQHLRRACKAERLAQGLSLIEQELAAAGAALSTPIPEIA